MSWNAVHDLAGMSLCCVEKKPATAPHNLPWSGGVYGLLHSLCWHTQIHGLDWGFTLELPAGYCGWTESDLLLNNVNFGLINSDVQISSAESSSGSRAESLVLELKSWGTDPLSWLAFMEEKERAVEPAGQHLLMFREPQQEALLSMATGWCPAYVPTMAPAHQVLLKAVDPKLKVRRKMLQPPDSEKGNYTERASEIIIQIWHHSWADLSQTYCIIDPWDLEQRLKNPVRSEKCFWVDFQQFMTFFPSRMLLQECFPLC